MPIVPPACSEPQNLVKLLRSANTAVVRAMSTRTREVIWGGRIMGADMRAQTARQEARKAARAADRAEAEAGRSAWKAMAGQRSQAQLSANA
jgi:hypothetical protein